MKTNSCPGSPCYWKIPKAGMDVYLKVICQATLKFMDWLQLFLTNRSIVAVMASARLPSFFPKPSCGLEPGANVSLSCRGGRDRYLIPDELVDEDSRRDYFRGGATELAGW